MIKRASLFGKDQAIVGDATTHGGVIISGAKNNTWHGVPIARETDHVFCPKCPPHIFEITEGLDRVTHMGLRQATHGHMTGCGATLIAESAPASRMAAALAFKNGNGYDAQIQFKNSNGSSLGVVNYSLTLANGETVDGVTDEEGKTAHIFTASQTAVIKAIVSPLRQLCCARSLERSATSESEWPSTAVDIQNIVTNTITSETVIDQVVVGDVRPMTPGEITMCRKIFKNSIDYNKVKIHKGAYLPLAGGNAMTPFGEPYFPVMKNKKGEDTGYQIDFSAAENDLKTWFIHEMTHVWQYQMGYGVASHGILIGMKGGYQDDEKNPSPAYHYDTSQNPELKKFSDFNMEQQGDIVAHYFAILILNYDFKNYKAEFNFNMTVMKEFLRNPSDKKLLPNTTDF